MSRALLHELGCPANPNGPFEGPCACGSSVGPASNYTSTGEYLWARLSAASDALDGLLKIPKAIRSADQDRAILRVRRRIKKAQAELNTWNESRRRAREAGLKSRRERYEVRRKAAVKLAVTVAGKYPKRSRKNCITPLERLAYKALANTIQVQVDKEDLFRLLEIARTSAAVIAAIPHGLPNVQPTDEQIEKLSAAHGDYNRAIEAINQDTRPEDVRARHPLPTKKFCSVCGYPQRSTPSGPTCANGHGGAPSKEEPLCPTCKKPARAPRVDSFCSDECAGRWDPINREPKR